MNDPLDILMNMHRKGKIFLGKSPPEIFEFFFQNSSFDNYVKRFVVVINF